MEDTEQTNRTMRDSTDTCPKCGNLNLEHGVCVPCQIKAGSVDAIVDAHAPEAAVTLNTGLKADGKDRVELLEFRQGSLEVVAHVLKTVGKYAEENGYTDCRVQNTENGYLISAKRK